LYSLKYSTSFHSGITDFIRAQAGHTERITSTETESVSQVRFDSSENRAENLNFASVNRICRDPDRSAHSASAAIVLLGRWLDSWLECLSPTTLGQGSGSRTRTFTVCPEMVGQSTRLLWCALNNLFTSTTRATP
jgi:hypothetical protein